MAINITYIILLVYLYLSNIPNQLPFPENNVVDSFPEVGLIFILFSIFIKLSVAPFHLWSLDVYEGSPTNSTIFFAALIVVAIP